MYFKYKLLTILNILDDSTDDDRGSDSDQTTSPHANKDCKCIIFIC